MTKKEAIEKMIPIYEDAIKFIGNDSLSLYEVKEYLRNKSLYFGICKLASDTFKEKYLTSWTHKYLGSNPKYPNYICAPPFFVETKEEIIESLQIRLNVLKKELKEDLKEKK
jgi:hypothetical protein